MQALSPWAEALVHLNWMLQYVDWAVGVGLVVLGLVLAWRWARRGRGVPWLPLGTGLAGLALVLVLAQEGSANGDGTGEACRPFDHAHPAWADVLSRHVRDGEVDYRGLKASGAPGLQRTLDAMRGVCADEAGGWSKPERLAFWINAYNAHMVRLVLDHHPLESIRDVGVGPGAAFRKRFIALPWHARTKLSLDDIEHRILRKRFDEPRIHFAVVCASRGCPPLRGEPYVAAQLDAQLDHAARGFIRDSSKNRYDAASRTLHLSPIFDWFSGDFEGSAGGVPAFVARYADPATAKAILAGDVSIAHLDYDWSLNGR
jgi:hypothetical protein